MAHILVVGLNPAWQKVMEIRALQPGGVNRFRSLSECASGKGINAARVLKKLGYDVTVLQVIGGHTGERILAELEQLQIGSIHVTIPGQTRTCTTLVEAEKGTATEVIEPFELPGDITEPLLARLSEHPGTYDGVLFCGSVPNPFPRNMFDSIWESVKPPFAVLDAVNGFSDALLEKIQGIKVNQAEFEKLKGRLPKGGSHSLEAILITAGGEPAELKTFSRTGVAESNGFFDIPPIITLNPIGAGDSVTAGFCEYWLKDEPLQSCIIKALALGSASCENLLPAHYNEATRIRILQGQ